MIEQSIEIGGRPPKPAYITLREKYGAHRAGCIRREIMAKKPPRKVSKLKRLKAQELPAKRPTRTEQIISSELANAYQRTRVEQQADKKFKGSAEELEHRLGMRLPRR